MIVGLLLTFIYVKFCFLGSVGGGGVGWRERWGTKHYRVEGREGEVEILK